MPGRAVVTQELANLFRVFSHPHRIQIIEELRNGEHDVNALEEALGISHSRVSQQLATLRAHRLVKVRREGRHVYYSLLQPEIARWLSQGLDFLMQRLEQRNQLRDAVEEVRHLWQDDEEPAEEAH